MPTDWAAVARRQHGVITGAQLLASGRSRTVVRRMTRDASLTALTRGVYLAGGAPLTWRARVWAAVVATGGVACLFTAGRLWEVVDVDDGARIDVLVRHERRVHTPPGVQVHRTVRWRGPIRAVDGLPATSRSWTVLDLLGALRPTAAGRFADRALQQGWLTHAEVDERLRRHPRRRGNAQLRRISLALGDGAASEAERVLHGLVRRAGVVGWVSNHAVRVDGVVIAVVDVAVPEHLIAIEVDGMAYHVDVDAFRRDRTRQNDLVALGWTVLRFTWADLTERPGYVVATLRRVAT